MFAVGLHPVDTVPDEAVDGEAFDPRGDRGYLPTAEPTPERRRGSKEDVTFRHPFRLSGAHRMGGRFSSAGWLALGAVPHEAFGGGDEAAFSEGGFQGGVVALNRQASDPTGGDEATEGGHRLVLP